MTGYTIITREVEWDDRERTRMMAYGLYESQVCDGCGFHESVTSDPANVIVPEKRFCTVCAGAEQYGRILHAEDEQADGENKTPQTPRPSDGRTMRLRQLTPEQAEAAKAKQRQRRQRGGESDSNSPRTRRRR